MIRYNLIHMRDPVETAELLAFVKTVDARSLSRAAVELGAPRATISRRLARLEERLGTRLIKRTTRAMSLTDAGEALYRHARIALDAVSTAEASVRREGDGISGDLRVSLPPLARPSLYEMIADFGVRHKGVRLQVHFGSAHVDLKRDGYDVALRAGAELSPGLVARTLSRMPLLAVASPEYLAQRGEPRTPRDLRAHSCLLGFARGELPSSHWPLLSGGSVRVVGVLSSNDINMLCHAALRGQGIALLPAMLTEPHTASGALVHVLRGHIGRETRLAVVYQERELLPPQVRAFVDELVAWSEHEAEGLRPGYHPRASGTLRSTRRRPKKNA
jgi:DNA-binding transcriptional LysR family regulator